MYVVWLSGDWGGVGVERGHDWVTAYTGTRGKEEGGD